MKRNIKRFPENFCFQLTKEEYENLKFQTGISSQFESRADLSDLMRLFDSGIKSEEILILNGEPFKADVAFQKIYKKAKKSIILVDDYLGVKALRHLTPVKKHPPDSPSALQKYQPGRHRRFCRPWLPLLPRFDENDRW